MSQNIAGLAPDIKPDRGPIAGIDREEARRAMVPTTASHIAVSTRNTVRTRTVGTA